jgi:hypothetical protein
MASSVEICNRALQKLGAKRITSLTDDSANARACNAAYDAVRLAELESHTWNCAVTRAEVAADSEAPIFGRARAFTLPADFLRLVADYPEDSYLGKDWSIEGNKIYSDDADPIYVRYVYNLTDVASMNPLFREALSAALALELCEQLTQSNTKKAAIAKEYEYYLRRARQTNALMKRPAVSPASSWITARA